MATDNPNHDYNEMEPSTYTGLYRGDESERGTGNQDDPDLFCDFGIDNLEIGAKYNELLDKIEEAGKAGLALATEGGAPFVSFDITLPSDRPMAVVDAAQGVDLIRRRRTLTDRKAFEIFIGTSDMLVSLDSEDIHREAAFQLLQLSHRIMRTSIAVGRLSPQAPLVNESDIKQEIHEKYEQWGLEARAVANLDEAAQLLGVQDTITLYEVIHADGSRKHVDTQEHCAIGYACAYPDAKVRVRTARFCEIVGDEEFLEVIRNDEDKTGTGSFDDPDLQNPNEIDGYEFDSKYLEEVERVLGIATQPLCIEAPARSPAINYGYHAADHWPREIEDPEEIASVHVRKTDEEMKSLQLDFDIGAVLCSLEGDIAENISDALWDLGDRFTEASLYILRTERERQGKPRVEPRSYLDDIQQEHGVEDGPILVINEDDEVCVRVGFKSLDDVDCTVRRHNRDKPDRNKYKLAVQLPACGHRLSDHTLYAVTDDWDTGIEIPHMLTPRKKAALDFALNLDRIKARKKPLAITKLFCVLLDPTNTPEGCKLQVPRQNEPGLMQGFVAMMKALAACIKRVPMDQNQ